MRTEVPVRLGARSYPVVVGADTLDERRRLLTGQQPQPHVDHARVGHDVHGVAAADSRDVEHGIRHVEVVAGRQTLRFELDAERRQARDDPRG